MKSHTFVESVAADMQAGAGGNGRVGFRREKFIPYGGPDGGDGGRGGHIILEADPQTDSLVGLYYRPIQRAGDGGHGMGKRQHGRNGKDLVIKVPCGTVVRDEERGEVLADLVAPGDTLCVARGGRGGLGNCHWKTSTHQAPREHTDGEPGERRRVRLDLKLVADIGLIGFPNAGKSTLLTAISHARPRVAPYPFTTLRPVLGTVQFESYTSVKVVDIPGLVQNAHLGVGLGHTFLRHVERAPCLVYVLDMAGTDGRHPADDFAVLRDELGRYNPDLPRRPMRVVANKMDLSAAAGLLAEFTAQTGIRPLPVSGLTGAGIEAFKEAIRALAASAPGITKAPEPGPARPDHDPVES